MATRGELIIGTFNASSEEAVNNIKQKAIELVDLIEEQGKCPRRKAIAITQIELGVMMGIKSLFN